MIFPILAYFITFFIVNLFTCVKKTKFQPLPKLNVSKRGISFFSNSMHRLRVGNVKVMQLDNVLYLKKANTMVIFKNINNIWLENGFLYFKAVGDVEILFNTEKFYRYFNIIIKSNKFNLMELRQKALNEVSNNLFNVKNCKFLNKYLNFVTKILSVHIDDEKVTVKSNKFKLNFTLIYKINNQIKRLNIEETI